MNHLLFFVVCFHSLTGGEALSALFPFKMADASSPGTHAHTMLTEKSVPDVFNFKKRTSMFYKYVLNIKGWRL